MKHNARDTHLRIYHAANQTHSITQKHMDLAVIVFSLAGLISAAAFLITMQ